jgi:hypothetical protein
MAVDRELIEFDRDDLSEVERRLAALPDGAWMNIEPIIEEADLEELRARTPHPLLRIFSAKGRPIPFGTIVAEPTELAVGLEHPQGAAVIPRLRELGIVAPASWRQRQDHPRRGVVYAVPRDEAAGVVLGWLLDAATALAGVTLRGRWSAVIARAA